MLPYATPMQVDSKINQAVAELKTELIKEGTNTGGSTAVELFNCSEVPENGAQQILDAYNAGKKLVYMMNITYNTWNGDPETGLKKEYTSLSDVYYLCYNETDLIICYYRGQTGGPSNSPWEGSASFKFE